MICHERYVAGSWADFTVAVVGAAAALTGLLFVAVSLNIERILAGAALTGRSGGTLIGILVLLPDQPSTALALELVTTGIVAGGSLLWINRPVNRSTEEPRASWLLLRVGTSVTISASLVLAGATLLAGTGGGLYRIAPAVLVAFLGGLMTVWVLPVEIRR